jgi:hypothetical protein
LDIFKFKKKSYEDFNRWIEWRLNTGYVKDSQQKRKDKIMCFLLIFEKQIIEIIKKNIDLFVPLYPWRPNFITLFEKDYEFTIKKEKEKIKNLEEKVKLLEKKIKLLEKK